MRVRIARTIVVGICVVVLTASCGKDSSHATGSTSTATTQAAPTSQAAAPSATERPPDAAPATDAQSQEDAQNAEVLKKWTGDLDGMIERRFIRVLTTYSKTTFFVDKGTQLGLTPDAFHMFEDDLNKKLRNKNIRVHVVFVPVAHDDLIPALLEGRGDVVSAGKLMTAWRAERVDFTNATKTGISSIIVSGPGVPPISAVQDLSGKDVYLRLSDVSLPNVERANAELKAKGKPPVRIVAAPEVLADEDILEMVNAGLAPMTMVDDYLAQFWQQVFPNLVLNTGAAVRTNGQTGMMVRKNSPKLLEELNAFIAQYPEGSAARNVLFRKYLQSVKYVKPATSAAEMARFNQTVGFVRRYSDQYGLDYLLVAAQGYQESGLDQRKKSSVGALGVMQVMPATGADMKVGDVTELEPNVHAGVKYIRFMMDRFYADEPMTDLDKLLFTFASYNAGPNRIQQLRDRAEKRGLDRNKWFNNVEILVSERIGRETVQYVSNIYKYYLAYKMASEQRELREKAKSGT
jgi:membrane-bound lytic murein transglycosylase MltF